MADAAAYDLRYSTSLITAEGFDGAMPAPGEPPPRAEGQQESCEVTGLAPGTVYHFALRVADAVPNWSDLSNRASGATRTPVDSVPPAAVNTLAVAAVTQTSATLTWTAVGDDGTNGTAGVYDMRYSTSPINEDNFAAAVLTAGPAPPNVAGQPETFTVTALAPGTGYYFAIKVGDEQHNWSAISNVPGANTAPPTDETPPSAVTTLAVESTTRSTATLTWIAVAGDRNGAAAAAYDLRYSTSGITDGDFAAAAPVENEPIPQGPGGLERFTVTGLTEGAAYWFALKVADAVPNWSELSNGAQGTTLAEPDLDEMADFSAEPDSGPAPLVVAFTDLSRFGPTSRSWQFGDGSTSTSGNPTHTYEDPGVYTVTLAVAGSIGSDTETKEAYIRVVAPPASDGLPPAPVEDLEIAGTGGDWVRLRWTATGDDGTAGTAAAYQVRSLAGRAIGTLEDWDASAPIEVSGSPVRSGERDSLTVPGLRPGSLHGFSLRVEDEAGNLSDLSNPVVARTNLPPPPDDSPPAPVRDLAMVARGAGLIAISWTAVGEDSLTGAVAGYEIRVRADQRIGLPEDWEAAGPAPFLLPPPPPAGEAVTARWEGVLDSWSGDVCVRARDAAGHLSPFVPGLSVPPFDAPNSFTAPPDVTSLAVLSVLPRSVILELRHPFPREGGLPIEGYVVGVSSDPITLRTWASADTTAPGPDPGEPGTTATWTVSGLSPDHLYYVAVRTRDTAGRRGGLSPAVTSRTLAEGGSSPALPPERPGAEWSEDGTLLVLSWPSASDPRVTGYRVYARLRSGAWEKIREVTAPDHRLELPRDEASRFVALAVSTLIEDGGESALSPNCGIPGQPWRIDGPFPHPVTDGCTFKVYVPPDVLPETALRIEILDLLGRRLVTLYDGPVTPGMCLQGSWDRSAGGVRVAPGYHYLGIEIPGHRILRTIYLAP